MKPLQICAISCVSFNIFILKTELLKTYAHCQKCRNEESISCVSFSIFILKTELVKTYAIFHTNVVAFFCVLPVPKFVTKTCQIVSNFSNTNSILIFFTENSIDQRPNYIERFYRHFVHFGNSRST